MPEDFCIRYSITLDKRLLIFYNGNMNLTDRQEKILNNLIREYINKAEPISSKLLKKEYGLNISPATIRNELQELTEQGYVAQPHTSAGRVPTEKAYRYFVDIIFSENDSEFPDFIFKEIAEAKQNIENELKLAKELTKSLTEISLTLSFNRIEEDILFDVLRIIGPSRTTYDKNISLINKLLKELESF